MSLFLWTSHYLRAGFDKWGRPFFRYPHVHVDRSKHWRGWIEYNLCRRLRGRPFFRYPSPLTWINLPTCRLHTPQPRPRAPRRRGRGYTQPGPRPGDNINHRGSVGTCKEGYGPTTAPVCCSMATVTRCNRFYGSTSTPVPPEPWERVKPLQNASAPITPALAPSSHLWPR